MGSEVRFLAGAFIFRMEEKIRKIGIYWTGKNKPYCVRHEIPFGAYPSSALYKNDKDLISGLIKLMDSDGSLEDQKTKYLPHFSPHEIKFDSKTREDINLLFDLRNKIVKEE